MLSLATDANRDKWRAGLTGSVSGSVWIKPAIILGDQESEAC